MGLGSSSSSTGLQVMILGFSCVNNEMNTDSIIPILNQLSSNINDINNALNEATEMNPNGGICPGLALEHMIEEIENTWMNVNIRPYKMSLVISNMEFYDFQKHSQRQNIDSKALRSRCVETLAIPLQISPNSLTPIEKILQLKFINEISGNELNVYELSNGEMNVIESISQNGGSQLLTYSQSSKCTNVNEYEYPPNIYCGYDETMCENRFGCIWTKNGKCKSVVNCNYPTQSYCLMDSIHCSYSNGKCISNSNCGSYSTKQECKSNKSCKFKKGVCIAKK